MNAADKLTPDITMQTTFTPESQRLEQEYERIWLEYGASLGRLASSYEWEPQARQDLLQEIRLAIWVALPKFRNESSLRTFIFRIAHNRALTHIWQKKRVQVFEE